MTSMMRQNPASVSLQKNGWWTRRLCCSSQEPCQGADMGRQGSHVLQQMEMQSPVPGPLSDAESSVIQQGSRSAVSQGPLDNFTSRLMEMVLPLYSTLVRQTWNAGPVLGPSVEKKGKYWGNSCKQLLSG